MMKFKVYKLTHTYNKEDSKIYFKSTMKQDDLLKLIKVWQYKLDDIVEATDLDDDVLMNILESFGCIRLSETDDFKSYTELNAYIIWEARNIKVSEDDMNNLNYNNSKAREILNNFVESMK